MPAIDSKYVAFHLLCSFYLLGLSPFSFSTWVPDSTCHNCILQMTRFCMCTLLRELPFNSKNFSFLIRLFSLFGSRLPHFISLTINRLSLTFLYNLSRLSIVHTRSSFCLQIHDTYNIELRIDNNISTKEDFTDRIHIEKKKIQREKQGNELLLLLFLFFWIRITC